ncbi:hypothetical protein SERLA73DRAFT_188329, partial [Serpula lacrymans var. lacrymans S7.3]
MWDMWGRGFVTVLQCDGRVNGGAPSFHSLAFSFAASLRCVMGFVSSFVATTHPPSLPLRHFRSSPVRSLLTPGP